MMSAQWKSGGGASHTFITASAAVPAGRGPWKAAFIIAGVDTDRKMDPRLAVWRVRCAKGLGAHALPANVALYDNPRRCESPHGLPAATQCCADRPQRSAHDNVRRPCHGDVRFRKTTRRAHRHGYM